MCGKDSTGWFPSVSASTVDNDALAFNQKSNKRDFGDVWCIVDDYEAVKISIHDRTRATNATSDRRLFSQQKAKKKG